MALADGLRPFPIDSRGPCDAGYARGMADRGDSSTTETTARRPSLRSSPTTFSILRCVFSPDPAAVGLAIPLDGTLIEVGRSSKAPWTIADRQMSRAHFRLEPSRDGGYTIRDLDTANGTYLNGQRVAGADSFSGGIISVGDTLFVADEPPDPDGMPSATGIEEAEVPGLIGSSEKLKALRRSVATVAGVQGPVLLLGETGVGKEVAARAIHELSGRAGEFVPVNCAAIPSELAESEFFGYVKGAFTGAEADRAGFFEQASGGTLFLDEVGDLPAPIQAKLLRVLEDSVVRRIGSNESRSIDIRVVAATHIDLDSSGFRRDLLARLSDWPIRLPRLSERRADIPELWAHFAGPEASQPELTAEVVEALLLHDWPMNVRELRRLTRRVVEMSPAGEPIDLQLLPRAIRTPLMERLESGEFHPSASVDSTDDVAGVDDSGTPGLEVILDALRASKGNVKQAAIDNGWHRNQLYRWLRRLRINPDSFRKP